MRLVVQQTHPVSAQTLADLATLGVTALPIPVTPCAYVFAGQQPDAAIAAYCCQHHIDHAFVPDSCTLDQFRLVVMDMDSTLITIECIDEIAAMQGLKPAVAAITESAMRGEIPFPESLKRRVALLQGLPQEKLQQVYDQRLTLSMGAETLIATLQKKQIKTLLVSGGFTFFTDKLKQRLHLDYTYSNTLEIHQGRLTGRIIGDILDSGAKAYWLNHTRAALGLQKGQVLAIGDGANDLPMMAEAGTSIAYHAKPIVRDQADYVLNYVGLDGVLAMLDNTPAP